MVMLSIFTTFADLTKLETIADPGTDLINTTKTVPSNIMQ